MTFYQITQSTVQHAGRDLFGSGQQEASFRLLFATPGCAQSMWYAIRSAGAPARGSEAWLRGYDVTARWFGDTVSAFPAKG